MNKYLSIITLNVNGLNAPIKRHRVAEWIRNLDPAHLLPTKDPPQNKRPTQTKVKGWKKIFKTNGEEEKKHGVVTLKSDKIDFKKKKV